MIYVYYILSNTLLYTIYTIYIYYIYLLRLGGSGVLIHLYILYIKFIYTIYIYITPQEKWHVNTHIWHIYQIYNLCILHTYIIRLRGSGMCTPMHDVMGSGLNPEP
jgi:hypothetical protein